MADTSHTAFAGYTAKLNVIAYNTSTYRKSGTLLRYLIFHNKLCIKYLRFTPANSRCLFLPFALAGGVEVQEELEEGQPVRVESAGIEKLFVVLPPGSEVALLRIVFGRLAPFFFKKTETLSVSGHPPFFVCRHNRLSSYRFLPVLNYFPEL